MKVFCKFLFLGLFLSVVSSCQKEKTSPVEETIDSAIFLQDDLNQSYQAYMAEYGDDLELKPITLEALNTALKEDGETPITLAELGISQEEYDAVHNTIAEGTAVSFRCDANIYQFLGDIDRDGALTYDDIDLARQVILGIVPPTMANTWFFGFLSVFWGMDNNYQVSVNDLIVAYKVILGFPCP